MPFTNFRSPYGFEPEDSDYQNAGGLLGLLRESMQREALQQGSGIGATPGSTPSPYSETYGNNSQGLLGRLLELRKQGIPSAEGDASFASSATLPAIPVQFRTLPTPGRLPGLPIGPMPPNPQSAPQIPMPHLPEPWPTIGKIIQALPGFARGLIKKDDENCPSCQEEKISTEGAKKKPQKPRDPEPEPPLPLVLPSPPVAPDGTEDGGWPSQEECNEERRKARKDCVDFMAGEKGKEYGGPWAKFRGAPFNFDRCVKSRISVACGGDRESEKRKK